MVLSFFYGCSKSVYLSSNGKDHLAILPPLVIFEPRKNISNESLKIHETEQSKIFQKEMHAYVLKMNSEKKDNLKIQDPEKTNVILKSNDANPSNISIKDTCEILKVDGVLFSKFSVPIKYPKSMRGSPMVAFSQSKTANKRGFFSLEKSMLWKL